MKTLCAIDTETGGLVPGVSPLLSLAAVVDGDWPAFYVLVLPEGPVDPGAAKVNGYTEASWKKRGAVSLEHARLQFRDWLFFCPLDLRPLAHNAGFDKAFVDPLLTDHQRKKLGHRWECSMAAFSFLQRAGVVPGEMASLDALCAWAGHPRPAVHDALADAKACLAGYKKLLKAAASQTPQIMTCLEHLSLKAESGKLSPMEMGILIDKHTLLNG